MSAIASVRAWEALDSRGRPTVAARVELADGVAAHATVPSGASTGSHEALELRDGGTRYQGRGVRSAVAQVNGPLAAICVGRDVTDQRGLDAALLAVTDTGGPLGANAVLAVSLAAARTAATDSGVSLSRLLAGPGPLLLPMPMVNIISGGAHAGGLLDVQDFLVVPVGATSFAEAIEWAGAVRETTTELALGRGHSSAVLVADEGGLGLALPSNRAALDLLVDGIRAAGLAPGTQIGIAIDLAATELFDGTGYRFAAEGRTLAPTELVDEIASWHADFPIVSIEDGAAEDEWDSWRLLTDRLGHAVELVGDDLFATRPDRLDAGIRTGVANSVLVKVNQNGTVTGAADVVARAHRAGYRTVVSARSGDTEDSWLADLAVGWRAGQIKVGSTQRSERTAKWNRLLELEACEDTTFAVPWPRPARPHLPEPSEDNHHDHI